MKMIKERYGKQAIVNLLGTSLIGSKEGEATLSNEFQVILINICTHDKKQDLFLSLFLETP